MGLRVGLRVGLAGGEQNMGRLVDVRRPELLPVILVISPACRPIRRRRMDLAIDERADGRLFGGLTPAFTVVQWLAPRSPAGAPPAAAVRARPGPAPPPSTIPPDCARVVLDLAGNHVAWNLHAIDLYAPAVGKNRRMYRAGHGHYSAGTARGRRATALLLRFVRTT